MDLTLVGMVAGKEIRKPLAEGRYVIGRAAEADIRLNEPSVSRQHAEISVQGGQAMLQDLGSHNGTKLNGAKVEAPTPIAAGDVIAVANLSFRAESYDTAGMTHYASSPTLMPGTELTWEEVQTQRRNRRDRQSRLFRVLAEAGDLLTITRVPAELFEPILDLVETALEPERTFLLLQDEEETEPTIKASRLKGNQDGGELVLSRTMVQRVLTQKTSFLTTDAPNDPSLDGAKSMLAQRIRSAMAVPLFDNEEVIGLLYADDSDPGKQFNRDELSAFTLLANVIAVAISHARYHVLEEEKRRQDAQLQTACEILQHILPAKLPACPGYDLTASLESCFEVGGDLYDGQLLPDGRYAFLIGDVVGKGLGAALLVSQVLSLARFMMGEAWQPAALMDRLNQEIFRATDTVRFTTVFLGYLEPDSGKVTYVNAGHNPPIVARKDGSSEICTGTGLPVGVLEDFSYATSEVTLAAGDMITLFSDGVSETHSEDDDEYGEERLAQLLVDRRHEDLSAVVDIIQDELVEFRGAAPVGDDVTLLLLRRQG